MIAVIPMAMAHIEAVYAIECHSFSDPWPIEEIQFEMEQKHNISIVALAGGEVAGYAIMRHVVNEGHICNIAVHEDYRQKGIGSAIVKGLIAAAKDHEMIGITLEVRIGNRAAMALYHRHGFIVEGYRRGYYKNPTEDAAIMWKYSKINEKQSPSEPK